MTKTFTTRVGKIRSQSQRRFILVGRTETGRAFIEKRSDKSDTLHQYARRSDLRWDVNAKIYLDRGYGYEVQYLVLDTVTGQEVPR